MKLAQFWSRQTAEGTDSKGKPLTVSARGWSNDSLQAAASAARSNASRILNFLSTQAPFSKRYFYGERPMPEPIITSFNDPKGSLIGAVTRNGYGSLVLNTQHLMFVDIDAKENSGGLFSSLFKRGQQHSDPMSSAALDPVRELCKEQPNISVRVYRTAAGYRLMFTADRYSPTAEQTQQLFKRLGTDPMYARLCQTQESFRARLTPKPWRCGTRNPTVSYPFSDAEQEQTFAKWEKNYNSHMQQYSTCHYLVSLGSERVLPEFDELLAVHDRLTAVADKKALA